MGWLKARGTLGGTTFAEVTFLAALDVPANVYDSTSKLGMAAFFGESSLRHVHTLRGLFSVQIAAPTPLNCPKNPDPKLHSKSYIYIYIYMCIYIIVPLT